MIRTAAATTAILLATTTLAAAQPLDEAIHDFIYAQGFTAEDIPGLEVRLIDHWFDLTVTTPGGTVGPLEKAMLIADKSIESGRTRTAIAYGEMIAENGAPYSFIEVRHYNMAAVIHAETADAYGIENTAPVEEFGRGPHMAWRFVFTPEMNNAAILLEASSRIISDKEASKADCMGRPCLDPYAGFDTVEWTEIEGQVADWPELYATQSDETSTPAHAIAQLAVFGFWANAESGDYQWTGGEHPEAARGAEPYRFIGIDRNLGQEASIDAVWQETLLNDDALSEIAFRRAEVGGTVYLLRSSVSR